MKRDSIFYKHAELRACLIGLKKEIGDDYRASDDRDDTLPGMQVTLACNDDGSEYALQTGDNSYTGAAYGFPHWAVSSLHRRTNCRLLARELIDELRDLIPA